MLTVKLRMSCRYEITPGSSIDYNCSLVIENSECDASGVCSCTSDSQENPGNIELCIRIRYYFNVINY